MNVDTMLKDPQTPRYAQRRTHRTYTPQFKAELVAMCQKPGASIAAVALQHGKRRLNTLLTRMTADSQTSRTWRSRAKPTRQWVPSPGSMVAV
ncbi:transposase, partial [Hydrogenophaga intermedia]|uniref:transposase n=1 Tax=Hydrogenophaga intermedia TaxID=65786 RepID=UPI002042F7A4